MISTTLRVFKRSIHSIFAAVITEYLYLKCNYTQNVQTKYINIQYNETFNQNLDFDGYRHHFNL